MARRASHPWPTEAGTVFYAGTAAASTVSRAVAQGRVRRLGTGIFSADLVTPAEALVLRNQWAILSATVPDALVVDRSAATGAASGGILTIVSATRRRPVELPGLTIAPRPGAPALPSDLPWAAGLHVTSDARTLLDNLAISRGRGGRMPRTLAASEVEEWLVRKTQLRPSDWLDHLESDLHTAAEALGLAERLPRALQLVSAARGTGPAAVRVGRILRAARTGTTWDVARLDRFDQLARHLGALTDGEAPAHLPEPDENADGSVAFHEAYFSNFIEGTEFSLEEAERIVATGEGPIDRPADAHDVLGTYRTVADPIGRAIVPADAEELVDLLLRRHAAIMVGRPDKHPGQLKQIRNQAGSYVFVEPELVLGTLAEGFRRAADLAPGFPRAVYLLYLVSEVHPFDDGNGRVARVLMNAELSAVGQARIIVPIVFRNEYLTALRALSRDGRADLLVRTMAYAWRWTAAMPWGDRAATSGRLEATNALIDSTDAERTGVRLLLP